MYNISIESFRFILLQAIYSTIGIFKSLSHMIRNLTNSNSNCKLWLMDYK